MSWPIYEASQFEVVADVFRVEFANIAGDDDNDSGGRCGVYTLTLVIR